MCTSFTDSSTFGQLLLRAEDLLQSRIFNELILQGFTNMGFHVRSQMQFASRLFGW